MMGRCIDAHADFVSFQSKTNSAPEVGGSSVVVVVVGMSGWLVMVAVPEVYVIQLGYDDIFNLSPHPLFA